MEEKIKRQMEKRFKKLKILDKIRVYRLAIKYYLNGDDWYFAKSYAISLIGGWKNI